MWRPMVHTYRHRMPAGRSMWARPGRRVEIADMTSDNQSAQHRLSSESMVSCPIQPNCLHGTADSTLRRAAEMR